MRNSHLAYIHTVDYNNTGILIGEWAIRYARLARPSNQPSTISTHGHSNPSNKCRSNSENTHKTTSFHSMAEECNRPYKNYSHSNNFISVIY